VTDTYWYLVYVTDMQLAKYGVWRIQLTRRSPALTASLILAEVPSPEEEDKYSLETSP
jgi:hypothetical protein